MHIKTNVMGGHDSTHLTKLTSIKIDRFRSHGNSSKIDYTKLKY